MTETKTMRISIDLSAEEYLLLKEKAADYGINVNGLLSQFIADLVCSDRSGGSDERMYVSYW